MVGRIKSKSTQRDEQNNEMRAINEQLVIGSIRQQELVEVAHRAEQRLRDFVHGLDAVICEVYLFTGKPTFINLNSEEFLGKSMARWHSEPNFLAEIIHPTDRVRVSALFPALVTGGQSHEYEFRALSADDEVIWMRNIVRLVHDIDGNATMLRCVIVDVTAQKQTAQALEAAYARESRITETLQRSLLFMPPEDSFPGFAVKTVYEPASEEALVGGDFWDTFACDHGHLAFILGDVMGHGLKAAMFTAELKYVMRGFVREHEHPGLILAQMNNYLCETSRLFGAGLNQEGNDAPLCLIVAIVDTTTGMGKVAVAGMEPPLLVRANGEMEEVKIDGLQLGVLRGELYEETAFRLESGDLLLLATDGVTEARHNKLMLGYDGLMQLVHEGRSLQTLQEQGQAILDGAKAFTGGNLRDDACILLARRR